MARLLFLGRLEDVAGVPELEVSEGPLAEIVAGLGRELAMALSGERIRIAHNGTLVSESGGIVLKPGDEVAFLPPVSGGSQSPDSSGGSQSPDSSGGSQSPDSSEG